MGDFSGNTRFQVSLFQLRLLYNHLWRAATDKSPGSSPPGGDIGNDLVRIYPKLQGLKKNLMGQVPDVLRPDQDPVDTGYIQL